MNTPSTPAAPPTWVRLLCGPALAVYFDEDCGICQATVRALRPLDRGCRLTFLGFGDEIPLPPGLDREALEARRANEIVVHVRSTGAVLGGARGVLQILAALPLLRFVIWLGRVPGLSHLLEAGYRVVARNRRRISAALGLDACRVHLPS